MLDDVAEFSDLFAFGVDALDIEIGIEALEGPTEDGSDFAGANAVGTLVFCVFGCPIGDANLAEEFAATVALVGFQNNV